MNIRDLREQRAVAVAAMRAIADKPAGTNGDLSTEQRAQFDTLKAQLTATEGSIERQQLLDDAERRMAGQQIAGSGDQNLDRALEGFSLLRAIGSQVPGVREQIDCGREIELSNEVARRSDLQFEGMAIPLGIFKRKATEIERRVVTSTLPADGVGGTLIATELDAGGYIDLLRAAMLVRRAGATVLTGLVGNLDIPRLKASAGSAWIAENAGLTASDQKHDKVTLSPKHCGTLVEYSRNMLLQSSIDVEMLARRDFAASLAGAIDKGAIVGGGSNEPTGVLSTASIGDTAIGAAGGPLTWAHVLDIISKLDDSNALGGSLAFFGNSKVTKKLRATQKVTSTDSRMIMEDPGSLAGYPYMSSASVPSDGTKTSGSALSSLLFGNWADLLIGIWSEFDLLVNPYETTAYTKGNVQVRGLATVDVKVRHVASFAACKDIVTT